MTWGERDFLSPSPLLLLSGIVPMFNIGIDWLKIIFYCMMQWLTAKILEYYYSTLKSFLFELKINLIINIGAKLRRPWPVSQAMSFDKDVILLLLLIGCSYDVIFVALTLISKFDMNRKRADENVETEYTWGLIIKFYQISSMRRNRNMKFDKRTVPFEDTNWSVIEISKGNITSNRQSSKTWVRDKEIA